MISNTALPSASVLLPHWTSAEGWRWQTAPPVGLVSRVPGLGRPFCEGWTQWEGERRRVRCFLECPVALVAGPVLPPRGQGWSLPLQGDPVWTFAVGAPGTSLEDLLAQERVPWPSGVRDGMTLRCGPGADWHGIELPPPGPWAAPARWAPDRPWLAAAHQPDFLQVLGQAGERAVVLLPSGGPDPEEMLDLLLYLHQTFGVNWVAPPSPAGSWLAGLERAHQDSQGELRAVWLSGPGREGWFPGRRLGPVARLVAP